MLQVHTAKQNFQTYIWKADLKSLGKSLGVKAYQMVGIICKSLQRTIMKTT